MSYWTPMVGSSERIDVPRHLLSARGGDHYVLRVVGDGMESERIVDGDYVIVRRAETFEDGEMAVVLIGDDATIKRLYREGDVIRLQPANASMPAIRIPSQEVRLLGIVVGLMRKFD